MSNSRPRFLSRRRVLAILGVLTLLFGVAMSHPYLRQSLFGPKINGEPWCARKKFRAYVHWNEKNENLYRRTKRWLGMHIEGPDLWKFRYKEAEPVLLALADDHDPDVRYQAAYTLIYNSAFRDRAALPFIRPFLNDPEPYVQNQAAAAIWRIDKDREMIGRLKRAIDDPRSKRREEAASYLATMYEWEPDADLLAVIQTYAKHPIPGVRQACLRAETHRGKDGVPALVEGLKDHDKDVRSYAAQLLGNFRSDALKVLPNLEACLRDEDKSVRHAAKNAIMHIDWRRYVELGFD